MKAPTHLRSPLSPHNLRNGTLNWVGASARGDRPWLLIPGWITTHDLKVIEQNLDLGMYLTVAV